MQPRPYQSACIDAVFGWWAAGRQGEWPCVVLPTAAGKTVIFSMLLKRLFEQFPNVTALILAHRKELIEQAEAKLKSVWPGAPVGVYAASLGRREASARILVAARDTVANKLDHIGQRTFVIIDECFPAGTKVLTPQGEVEIESITAGDVVMTAIGPQFVESTFSKHATDLVKVEFSDGTSITCTADHPIFTDRGWVEARSAHNACVFAIEDVRALWEGFFPQDSQCNDLEKADFLREVLRKEIKQSHAHRSESGKDVCIAQEDWTQAVRQRRERNRADRSAENDARHSWSGVDSGVGNSALGEKRSRLPDELQGRHRASIAEDSDRAGWPIAQREEKIEGREKGRSAALARVVRVSSVECASPVRVFNLRVSGHPSYFAGGKLVHNCHNINQKEEGRYRKILADLKERYPHLVVIGFTATPFRLGQGRIYGKGKLFADVCFKIGMQDLISQGFLAPLTSQAVGAGEIDTTGVRTVGGDFDERELAEIATADTLVDAALADWKAKAFDTGREATVFFCVSRLHAQIVSEKLARMGIDCPFVTGETPDAERTALLAGFARGDFPAIANVGILTEGWDCPRCDCIALLRPTQSAALYVQMVGRGLRLSENKADCLVLDYGGNIKRLGPVDQADVAEPKGGDRKNKKSGPCDVCTRDLCKTCGDWGIADDGKGAWIGGCGHHNATGAKQCEACGQPFISHDTRSAAGGIISTERVIEVFDVEEVSVRAATSREGKRYLRVAYQVSLFECFYKNVMLGYPGYAGQKAAREWERIAACGEAPDTPDMAVHSIGSGDYALRPVARIHVDTASRWKDVVHVEYANEEEHEHAL